MTDAPAPLIGYLRVSTDLQEISIDAQRAAIAAQCAARGWPEPEWAVDQGWSGSNLERPAIEGALASLDAAGAGVLLAAKLDRISRSTADFIGLLERARTRGWQVIALDIGVDMTTPAGRLIATILAALAQWERDVIRERTRVALAQLRSEGKRLGRPSTIPTEIVERIVAERAAGRTLVAIAEGLTADNVPTARGAARWTKSTVHTALGTAQRDADAFRVRETSRRAGDITLDRAL